MNRLFITIALTLASIAQVQAAEIKLLSTGLFRGVMPVMAPAFERASGHKVIVTIATPGAIRDRLVKGEQFDVVLLPTNLNFEDLAKNGVIAMDSRKDIGRTSLAVAVPAKAAKLDLSSIEAMKSAIVAAKTIALSDPAGGGPIGRYVQQAAEKFGFGADLKARTKAIVGGGEEVAGAVAKGEADLAITLASEIATVRGVQIGGFLPEQMQLVITGYGIIVSKSSVADAGKALIAYMTSPEGRKIMQDSGVDPL